MTHNGVTYDCTTHVSRNATHDGAAHVSRNEVSRYMVRMSHHRVSHYVIHLSLLLLLTACFKVELPICPKQYTVLISVSNGAGEEITSRGEAGAVMVYVFDENRKFLYPISLSSIDVQANRSFLIEMLPDQSRILVAWGNLSNGQSVSVLSTGSDLDEALVKLYRDAANFGHNPDDLFYGNLTLHADTEQSLSLPIRRKTARMHITVRGLPLSNPDNYHFLIGGSTQDTYNFAGQLGGSPVDYLQKGSFTTLHQFFVSPVFTVFPSTENNLNKVSLYKGNVLLAQSLNDINGRPIDMQAGVTTNIFIDYSGGDAQVEVQIKITDWYTVYQWSEW